MGTSSTSAPDTTTATIPTTTATASADFPPVAVMGLTVEIGGGSGEVIPTWDRGTELGLDHYNVWYSFSPSTGKTLLASVDHDVATLSGSAYDAGTGRTAYVDFPRTQAEATECYQISAVDQAGNEGDRSSEICLSSLPPGLVSAFTVDIGGGSGVTAYVDFPRELTNDGQCYQISAVDTSNNEGSRTVELCLTDL